MEGRFVKRVAKNKAPPDRDDPGAPCPRGSYARVTGSATAGRCVRLLLALADVRRAHAPAASIRLRLILNPVASTKLVECDALQGRAVEEQILLAALLLDETETPVGDARDSSLCHSAESFCVRGAVARCQRNQYPSHRAVYPILADRGSDRTARSRGPEPHRSSPEAGAASAPTFSSGRCTEVGAGLYWYCGEAAPPSTDVSPSCLPDARPYADPGVGELGKGKERRCAWSGAGTGRLITTAMACPARSRIGTRQQRRRNEPGRGWRSISSAAAPRLRRLNWGRHLIVGDRPVPRRGAVRTQEAPWGSTAMRLPAAGCML